MNSLTLAGAGFLAGFLSSGHCLGMCGPIAFLISSKQEHLAAGRFKRLLPIFLLGLGKAFTYGWIGLIFGAAGHLLTRWGQWLGFAKALPFLSGITLICAGFSIAGRLPVKLHGRIQRFEVKLFSIFQSLKKNHNALTLFAGGMIWGFLPCPMVLVPALAAAVSGGAGGVSGAMDGFFMMFGFGLGTIPALTLSGAGGNYLFQKLKLKWSPAWSGLCLAGLGAALIVYSGFHAAFHPHCH